MSEAGESSETHFNLDKDQRDALRLEAQALTPQEQIQFESLVATSNQEFLKEFGGYIPKGRHLGSKEAAAKFLITDHKTHQIFDQEWRQTPEGTAVTSYANGEETEMSPHRNKGDFVVGNLPK